MKKFALLLFIGVVASSSFAQPALAVKKFSDQFMKLYDVDKKSEEKTDFAKLVLKAKCYTCHQGKKKKNRNAYGAELAKLLDKKKDGKKPEKIIEALEKVAKMHSDPNDKKSPTFGELIKEGKLPGGSLEDSKKEPAKEPAKKETDKQESDSKDSNKQEVDKKGSDKK